MKAEADESYLHLNMSLLEFALWTVCRIRASWITVFFEIEGMDVGVHPE